MESNKTEEQSITDKAEQCKGTMFSCPFYHHGAHAGNVYYRVEGWGMNSESIEDEVIRLVGEFIKGLNFKRNFSSGPVIISCAHPLTAKQIAEWVQLKQ